MMITLKESPAAMSTLEASAKAIKKFPNRQQRKSSGSARSLKSNKDKRLKQQGKDCIRDLVQELLIITFTVLSLINDLLSN